VVNFSQYSKGEFTMKTSRLKMKVIKVTKTEVEFEDGTVIPHLIEFEDDEIPTIEEFQKTYNEFLERMKETHE